MAYFDPFCPIFTDLLFLNWILWWQTKAIWKKLSKLLDIKFHEFWFGKVRFLISFHLLNLWEFAVSFPNGGSTLFSQIKDMVRNSAAQWVKIRVCNFPDCLFPGKREKPENPGNSHWIFLPRKIPRRTREIPGANSS